MVLGAEIQAISGSGGEAIVAAIREVSGRCRLRPLAPPHERPECEKVVLTKAARMTGDIYYEIPELHEGAEFEGGMRRTGASSSRPVTSAGMAPNEPQQPVHASPG